MSLTSGNKRNKHDGQSSDRCFNEGDTVLVKNFQSGNKWLPGVISRKTGPVSFVVQMYDGRERRCHQDQLQRRTVDVTVEESIETDTTPPRADTIYRSALSIRY